MSTGYNFKQSLKLEGLDSGYLKNRSLGSGINRLEEIQPTVEPAL